MACGFHRRAWSAGSFFGGKRLAPLVLVGCGEDAEVLRGSLVVSLAEQVYVLVVEDRRGTLNR